MVKYKITKIGNIPDAKISAIEIEEEEEYFVWIKGIVNLKKASRHRYFDTWQEAYNYILELTKKSIKLTEIKLNKHRELLINIKKLRL